MAGQEKAVSPLQSVARAGLVSSQGRVPLCLTWGLLPGKTARDPQT